MKFRALQFAIISGGILASLIVEASACCGGGSSAPALILGDDRGQLSTSISHSTIAYDVNSNEEWRRRTQAETIETLRIDSAHILSELSQVGLSVPVIRRNRGEAQNTGLGDVALTYGYEYISDWNYNPYRPKAIGFLQLTLPTGKSIYASESQNQLDARGRGFWAFGIGTALTKRWGPWDASLIAEIHRSLDKDYSNSQSSGTLKPGFGQSATAGLGYWSNQLRLNIGLMWSHEDPVTVQGTINSPGSPQEVYTGTIGAHYPIMNSWIGLISYSDQTILGDPENTTLNRTLMISLQKSWLR